VVPLLGRLPHRHPLHGRIHRRQLQARGDEGSAPARTSDDGFVYIASNITFDNLAPLSTYLGKPGDPAKGGLPFAEYMLRQEQHRAAECLGNARHPRFHRPRAEAIYGYPSFVCDTSGSICEVVNPDDPSRSGDVGSCRETC
jgi:hypothetical protein